MKLVNYHQYKLDLEILTLLLTIFFILHSLINLYLSKKKKLFCTFIYFSRTFDTIWRVGLWQKLIENNISGKCFNAIKSWYQNVKSCVTKNGKKSDYFACNVGVRQVENL
jgi:hypothetical protein